MAYQKHIVIVAFSVFTFFVLSQMATFAFAQTDDTTRQLPDAGMLPDHPLYGLKKFWEGAQMAFTFDHEGKARLHARFADQRLAEFNMSLSLNKMQLADGLQWEYSRELNDTQSELETDRGLGGNVTTLAEHVAAMTYKHHLVLEALLERLPESAKLGVQNAMDNSDRGHERAIETIMRSRNVTGTVNITFTIGNRTFTETYNVTDKNGGKEMERQEINGDEDVNGNGQTERERQRETDMERSCVASGGIVTNSTCCNSVEDFPNTCSIGACGCSLEYSHTIKTCSCPEGTCFDGERCSSSSGQQGNGLGSMPARPSEEGGPGDGPDTGNPAEEGYLVLP
jgi:hypothetical protein